MKYTSVLNRLLLKSKPLRYGVEPTHEDFLNRIKAEPDEHLHRLVYADWLQEHGHPHQEDIDALREHTGPAWVHRDTENKIRVGHAPTSEEVQRIREHFNTPSYNGVFRLHLPIHSGPGGHHVVYSHIRSNAFNTIGFELASGNPIDSPTGPHNKEHTAHEEAERQANSFHVH